MLTLMSTKTQNLKYLSHLIWEYSFYLRQELRNPMVYLTSLLIGFLVTWLMQTPSMIPLLVSWIVLIAANAIQQFKNSDIKTLLLLPAHREDPAFVMDLDGKVVLSAGKTDRLFQKESISNINYSSASTFDQKYRFDERVRSFLDVPIQNFINYPAGEYLQPLYCREAWFRFGIRGNHRAGGGLA